MTYNLLNWICWVAFVVVWILGAVYNHFKALNTVKRHVRYDWVIFAIVAWLAIHFVPLNYSTVAVFNVPWLQAFGAMLLLIFTAFTF